MKPGTRIFTGTCPCTSRCHSGCIIPFVKYEGNQRFPVPEVTTSEGFPTTMSVDYVRVWQRKPSGKSPTDWSRSEFISREKVKSEQNGWPWNQPKVESNFDESDTTNDGGALGNKRQDSFAKKDLENAN